MSGRKVVVVGGGLAGLSSAWALRQSGVTPTILSRGIGATAMTSGAFDLTPWTAEHRAPASSQSISWLAELEIATEGGTVATLAGIVRPTAAVGARILCFDGLAGKRVGIPNWERSDFTPGALVASLSDCPWARQTNTRFELLDVPHVLDEAQLKYPLPALSALFDEQETMTRLLSSLEQSIGEVDAVLVGPWLGQERAPLRIKGKPVGEMLSPPEGAFGRRLERAFQAGLRRWGLEVRGERVALVSPETDAVRVETADDSGKPLSTIWADGVVLATGGLIGHGVDLLESDERPAVLEPMLGPRASIVGGARDGWDPTADGGQWIAPPHWARPPGMHDDPRIIRAGDVRAETSPEEPGGTALGAIESGFSAATKLLARLNAS